MLFLALPGTYSQVVSTASSDSRSEAKERRHVSGGFSSSFFASSDCEHRTTFKTTVEFDGEFNVFEFCERINIWEVNHHNEAGRLQ